MSKRINIQIDDIDFVRLKGIAKIRRYTQPGTLARIWLLERIDQETKLLEQKKELIDGCKQENAFESLKVSRKRRN
ncbi:MAG TPA: hypothetical protein VLH56_19620 [Dissulfurispiraceae bacterium]|nr:hypothetical protein [Dissulfurispiraceae bacterium]